MLIHLRLVSRVDAANLFAHFMHLLISHRCLSVVIYLTVNHATVICPRHSTRTTLANLIFLFSRTYEQTETHRGEKDSPCVLARSRAQANKFVWQSIGPQLLSATCLRCCACVT